MRRRTRAVRKDRTERAIKLLEKRLTLPDDDIKLTAKRFRKKLEKGEEITEADMNEYRKDMKVHIQKMRDAHGIKKPNEEKSNTTKGKPKKKSQRPVEHRRGRAVHEGVRV